MKSSTLKNSMLSGLLVTALLAPSGAGSAASGGQGLPALSGAAPVLLDLQAISVDRLQSIRRALELGLIQGDDAGRFRPDELLTRQELAALLTRALKLPIPQTLESFDDVETESWSAPYVAAVKLAGIMQGDEANKFRPFARITREELAITLVRAAGGTTPGSNPVNEVTDWSSVSSWAEAFVRTAIDGGIMPISHGKFSPQEPVLRADIAQMLISAFYPDETAALLEEVGKNSIRINGITYQLSDHVKGIFQESNRSILKGAKLKFRSSAGTIQSVTELRLQASGTAAEEKEAEFSRNLKFDGRHATLDGSLTVAGDYSTITNLTVAGDLHIHRDVENDFLASNLTVRGRTTIEGGDSNTVVFQNSTLQEVDVKKQDVHVVSDQGSSIASMNVQTNATIQSVDGSIKSLTIAEGAKSVELQGAVPSVTVTSTQPVNLGGSPTIQSMAVNNGATVNVTGAATISQVQLNNAGSKVIAGTESQVGNVVATNGASASNVQKAQAPEPNTAPKVETPIPDIALTIGDAPLVIDLSKHFKDAEQSTLKYIASSLKSSVIKSSLAGSILTLTAAGAGSTSVRVIADDQNGLKLTVDIKAVVNAPPKVADPAKVPSSLVLTVGKLDEVIDLNPLFTDSDKDPLTFSAESSQPGIAAVTESAGKLTITPEASGQSVIKATASDGRGGFASISIHVTVNEAPVILPVPEQIVHLGAGVQEIDLTPYVTDKENDALTITLDGYDATSVSAAVAGSKLLITPVKAGQSTVSFCVNDGRGGIASGQLQLKINRVPKVQHTPADMTLTVGTADSILDISQVFTDEDLDSLVYEVSSSQPGRVTVSEAGGQLTLHPIASGSSTITLLSRDSNGGEAAATFTVHINEAPSIAGIPAQIIQLGTAPYTLDLAGYLSDPEQDALILTAVSGNPAIASVQVSGLKAILTGAAAGDTTVALTVADGRGGVTVNSFSLKVNTAPALQQQLPAQQLTVGTADGVVDLSPFFGDADGDALTYEVVSSQPGTVHVEEAAGVATLRAIVSGTSTITVKAKDGKGGEKTAGFQVTVNEAPVIAAVPAQIIQLGGGVQEVDLTPYLSDTENDTLIVTATVDATPIATVSVAGAKLLFTALSAGDAQVSFTAADGRGGKAASSFALKVNTVPELVQQPAAQTLNVGAADGSLDLEQVFGDADQDALSFEANAAQAGVVALSETAGRLTIQALASGTTTITVKALDHKGGERSASFQVTVNEAPLFQTVPVQIIQLGSGVQEFDLSPYVQDKEQDAWTAAVDEFSAAIVDVGANGTKLLLTPAGAGMSEVKVTVTDARGGIAQGTVYVAVNTAPASVQTLSKQIVTAGQAPALVDLAPFFADADGDTLTYEVTSSQPTVATGSEAGGQLAISGLAPGTARLTVTAKDGRGGSANMSFDVEINAAPVIQAIPDQIIQLQGAPLVLNLLPYVQDPEQEPMTLQASINNAAIASVQANGFELTITPLQAGSAQISVVATDSRGGQTKSSITLAVNTAPVQKQQPQEQSLTVGQEDGVLDLSLIFTDPDADTLTYSVTSSSPSVAAASETGGILKTHALASGTAAITVTAKDGRGGQASSTFNVVVNEPPVAAGIPLQKLVWPGSPRTLDLSAYLTDTEQDTLTVTGITYNETIAALTLNDLLLTMTPISIGQTTVTMSVYDGRGGTASSSFQLKVTPPNQDPVVQQPMTPAILTAGQADKLLDLATIFSDPDAEDTLTYEASSSDSSIASVTLTGSQATVHAITSGSADIVLKASDGKGGETEFTWKVTVNQPPVIGSLAAQTIWMHEGEQELDLTALITDPDAADTANLQLSAVSSAPAVASVTVTGKKLKINPEAAGAAQIELTVNDGRGGKATAHLSVTIKQNQAPAISPVPEQVMKVTDSSMSLDLAPYLTDPDSGDVQGLTVSISAAPDSAVATAGAAGKQLTITPVGVGKTSVQVTVSDGRGGTAAGNVAITVNPAKVNQAPQAVAAIYEQVLTPGVTNARSYDLSQLFEDPDGDAMTFTAVSASSAAAAASVSGSTLTLTPGTGSASTQVTITATDGDGAKGTYVLTVRTAQLVANGHITVTTKTGVKDPIIFDLSTLFPGETSFTVYQGTPDSTFTGPTTLSGDKLTFGPMEQMMYTWVIGADGRAAVFQYKSNPQGTAERFISQYLDGGDGRIALQVSYAGTEDTSKFASGYTLEVHKYMKKTNKKEVVSTPLFNQFISPYVFTNYTFYDPMDIMPIQYINDPEIILYDYAQTEFNVVAIVLKRNGQILDVLGNPNGTEQFMSKGGTIVRKAGIVSGSGTFSQYGEWNTFPKGTYQYFTSRL
ncbi:S-layer homology domain-containing protein [Paenibacillus sp. UNCCL117]|uniref:S-layer homology domain-containing protein n=1 Tax=unclassified Paenibacillus TaxID=185978 RepID=UPI0008860D4E|nr:MULTISPECIES: S-layer homology domain-containing protein [unclassified Paenibacillus]SDD72073.1 S-layer homology domain-containing protein [Paenibacillus sp. cl123]SFW45658.1 S-layer homology domain-containing protein [Paenibacillus sp. UNCCL117]